MKIYINYVSNLQVLEKAPLEDLSNEFIRSEIIIKAAYSVWDFIDEELWLEMLKARNDLSHMYNEAAARNLVENILNKYIGEFQRLRMCMQEQYGEMLLEEEI